MNEPDHHEFQELLQLAIDGQVSADDLTRLQDLAKNNPERIRELVDHFQIISMLQDEGDEQSLGDLVDFYSPTNETHPKVFKKLVLFPIPYKVVSLAALVIISCLLWLFKQDNYSTTIYQLQNQEQLDSDDFTNSVAQISQQVGVKWLGQKHPIKGTALVAGLYQFSEGLVEFEFFSGAKVVAEGPAKIELLTPYEARVFHGKIRAFVPEQAQGFSIQTSNFELIDLGTEFGLDINESGEADVQVFDGEVEIHTSKNKKSITQGQAYRIDSIGTSSIAKVSPESYPSFKDVHKQAILNSNQKLVAWRLQNETLKHDPRIVLHYDFENNIIPHGTIVGCEWTEGRWPGKGALEFRRIGDRIRIDIPGEYEELTLMAWVRLSSIHQRHQALILTDQYEQDRIHWQISREGELCLGARQIPGEREKWRPGESPIIFKSENLGLWSFICTTFNMQSGALKQYMNGQLVKEYQEDYLRPLKIGTGDIGNWSVPVKGPSGPRPLRNFSGRMDQLTIWNKELSSDEVQDIYTKYRP